MMGPRHHVRPTAHRIATGQGRAVLMMEADHSHSSVRFGETTCTPTLPLDAKARLCEHLRRPARRNCDRPSCFWIFNDWRELVLRISGLPTSSQRGMGCWHDFARQAVSPSGAGM